jgi:hypothetical protein
MVSLEIIEREEPATAWLDQFKAYASVADDSQDSLLNALLVRACIRVQEMADRSILACTLELADGDVEDNTVRLYQTVSEVLDVTTAEGHRQYWQPAGKNIRVYSDTAVVRYKTEPRTADIDRLLPIVYQYATALYDGEDSKTLANILTQCL